MSLQVWLPLNGSLNNQGLSNISVVNNSTTINNNGKIGQCYSFDKSIPSYLKIDNPITSTEYGITFTFWIKIAANASGNNQIIHIGNGAGWNNNRCTCFIRSGTSQIVFCCGDGTDTSASHSTQYNCISSAIDLNTWVHITCIYFNKNLKIYINGIQNKSYDTTIIPSFTNVNYIGIGAAPNAGEPCSCMLNDIRIYNHILSDKEIEEISKGLVLHYKLDGKNEVILPSEYQQLEYIERTDGKRILDLETNQAADIHYEMKFQCSTNESNYIFGSKQIGSMAYNGMYRITGQEVNYQSQTLNANNVINQPIVLMQTLDNTGTTITTTCNGATTTHAFGSLNSGDTDKITFFGIPNSSIRPYGGSIRLYWLRIKNLYGIIRDLVPAKRLSDNQVGMYDIKNNNFLYTNINSNSTTDFTAGPNVQSSGIVYDSSGYQNNGIVNTSITVNSNTARYGRSSYFGNYNEPNIILQNTNILPALNNCTVCWWGKYDTTKTLLLTGQNTSTYLAASDANTFYHAAAGSPVMYKNGVQGTYSCVAGTWDFYVLKNVNLSSWTAMKINSYGSGWPLKGYISDFRIYATALTDDQIKDLYNTSATIDNLGNIYTRELVEI